jgi:lipoprotein-anchoring transpeptidase ErfK/SrfK
VASSRRTPPSRRQAAKNRRAKTAKPKPAKPRRTYARGRRVAVAFVLIALLALPFGALAWADHDARGRVPEGTRIAGIDVGGLNRDVAIKRLRAQVSIPARRSVKVTVDNDVSATLTAKHAHVRLNIRQLVDRAIERGRRGSFLTRGWRELTGAKLASSAPVRVRVDRRAVQRFVDSIATEVEVPAKPATFDITTTSVGMTEGHDGARLADRDALVGRLVAAMRDVGSEREFTAETEAVEPPATDDTIWEAHPSIVTVSHDEKLVRVFERGELVKSYKVAVGQPAYPTPYGTFTVQTMQVDPPWNVPDSDWAGDLAGTTIPGGSPDNPLKARFIGFDGSVGFHGTSDIASLGTAASHGCVRMQIADVKDLYDRVSVGTTVYVG